MRPTTSTGCSALPAARRRVLLGGEGVRRVVDPAPAVWGEGARGVVEAALGLRGGGGRVRGVVEAALGAARGRGVEAALEGNAHSRVRLAGPAADFAPDAADDLHDSLHGGDAAGVALARRRGSGAREEYEAALGGAGTGLEGEAVRLRRAGRERGRRHCLALAEH
jgi:hypothetical protein